LQLTVAMCENKRMNDRNNRDKENWLFGLMNKRRGREQSLSFFVVCNIVAYFMNKNKQNQEIILNYLIS
jgi:hypothetical protein